MEWAKIAETLCKQGQEVRIFLMNDSVGLARDVCKAPEGFDQDLIERMNNKVIPLLLELYMNEEKEVTGILESAGLIIEKDTWPLKILGKK